jgi:poly-gamma-glutamate capsule biosynthesis protein CapA/YwtB (metallophosphatase superfamily)
MTGKRKQEVRKRVAQRHSLYGVKALTMSPSKRYVKTQAKARQRRRLKAQQRLERDRRQAQRIAEALEQTLEGLDLSITQTHHGAKWRRRPPNHEGEPRRH